VACWRTKAAISRKRVKIQEKLLWTAYRNSPTLFRTVPSRTPYGLPFPKTGGLQLSYPLISGTGKATDFKFGGYIYRAYPNKSPLQILEKRESGRIQGLPKFLGYPLLSQEGVKLRTSNFVGTFIGLIGTKAHEMLGIVPWA